MPKIGIDVDGEKVRTIMLQSLEAADETFAAQRHA